MSAGIDVRGLHPGGRECRHLYFRVFVCTVPERLASRSSLLFPFMQNAYTPKCLLMDLGKSLGTPKKVLFAKVLTNGFGKTIKHALAYVLRMVREKPEKCCHAWMSKWAIDVEVVNHMNRCTCMLIDLETKEGTNAGRCLLD